MKLYQYEIDTFDARLNYYSFDIVLACLAISNMSQKYSDVTGWANQPV
jgi:hypothetical protein